MSDRRKICQTSDDLNEFQQHRIKQMYGNFPLATISYDINVKQAVIQEYVDSLNGWQPALLAQHLISKGLNKVTL